MSLSLVEGPYKSCESVAFIRYSKSLSLQGGNNYCELLGADALVNRHFCAQHFAKVRKKLSSLNYFNQYMKLTVPLSDSVESEMDSYEVLG